MLIVIRNDIESSEKSAGELHDKLMHEHQLNMLRFDLEDLIKNILAIGLKLYGSSERMRSLAPSAADMANLEDEFAGFYREVEKLADEVLAMMASFENEGFVIAGKPELRKLREEIGIANTFPLERVRRAMNNVREGKTISLSAIKNAL